MLNQFTFSEILRKNSLEQKNWGFLFYQNKLLIKTESSSTSIPYFNSELFIKNNSSEGPDIKSFTNFYISFGMLKGESCFTGVLDSKEFMNDLNFEENVRFSFVDLRELALLVDKNMWQIASIAFELVDWYQKSGYCGRCGSEVFLSSFQYAKKCPSCGYLDYPRVSPSIIVSVKKGDKILLAHNAKFPKDLYSVIAGFVNPGENLEDAVKREVNEEVGIEIKNIKYVASQPWPFPNSLMIGFTADFDSGDITPDGREITTARWFKIEELPKIPSKISIARHLIDRFVEEVIKKE
ncbi:MAG: NAD(+) diphosphatase [Candidatus Lokiarchaeota archaeon]|nr:NAD(+) diphosphatase [Candidatus Lokiarchaeota archaeon]